MDEHTNYSLFKDMLKLYKEIKKIYEPRGFLQLLTDSEGDSSKVISRLMEKDGLSGFTRLCAMKRPDLTVEALILRKYKNDVSAEIVKECERRLKKV